MCTRRRPCPPRHQPYSLSQASTASALRHGSGTSCSSHSHTEQSRSEHMPSSGHSGHSQYRSTWQGSSSVPKNVREWLAGLLNRHHLPGEQGRQGGGRDVCGNQQQKGMAQQYSFAVQPATRLRRSEPGRPGANTSFHQTAACQQAQRRLFCSTDSSTPALSHSTHTGSTQLACLEVAEKRRLHKLINQRFHCVAVHPLNRRVCAACRSVFEGSNCVQACRHSRAAPEQARGVQQPQQAHVGAAPMCNPPAHSSR